MNTPSELTFDILSAYDALWDGIGGQAAMSPAYENRDNWLLRFREGLRGMLARVYTVDRHFAMLREYQEGDGANESNPNWWAVVCEHHAGAIFFGMDSSLECLVYALNALGFARYPAEFRDIRDARELRRIGPGDVWGANARPGFGARFPKVTAAWGGNAALIECIVEYHDVSKHRSAVVQGGDPSGLSIREDPKQPGSMMSSTAHTVESLAMEYRQLIEDILGAAVVDGAALFGYAVEKLPRP